ncbi:hypothetical protein IMZ08_03425 [Bacillus luteolus]|uniref:SbsC C-terminal domain-containing protein n=1 Tax=Litchfieldia luteola TaxID=682179 RepID=A0ABR9QF54_9BACI|nr:hypothetical protein [Cytobacillus luteolus]MBE4907108.1 hypothetical protein [Cytobacillus luteolus]MBP1943423.1 hypothetical protein [Cytobacillus luteolus]
MRKFGRVFALTAGLTLLYPIVQAEASTYTEAERLVSEAEKHAGSLKWQISVEHTKEIKYPDMLVFNATKDTYLIAKSATSKLNAIQRKQLEERLATNVEVHYNRAIGYIDAITSGRKITEKTQRYKSLFEREPTSDHTEAAYHSLSEEIRKQASLLYRVYGQSTRSAILNKYKQPGQAAINQTIYPITTKMEIDKLGDLIERKSSQEKISAKVEEIFGLFEFIYSDEFYEAFYGKYAEVIRKDPYFVQMEIEVRAFFERYNDAYNTEDIDKVKLVLHEDYPYREGDIELAIEMFPIYDLKFESISIEVLAILGDIAIVRVVETEINEGDIEHEQMLHEVLYELKLSNGEWKVLNLQVIDSSPFNKEDENKSDTDNPAIEDPNAPVVKKVY